MRGGASVNKETGVAFIGQSLVFVGICQGNVPKICVNLLFHIYILSQPGFVGTWVVFLYVFYHHDLNSCPVCLGFGNTGPLLGLRKRKILCCAQENIVVWIENTPFHNV